ncbi:TonB-dependent siderophore receptor [Paracoccus indicus]|uniref:TonB-dependent siderophore receptor n=1 Tax=Paracoccus indicus TaxID=2079229 RepID=UPI000D333ED8|nr:TonB-dependent siderophore receptor [Paracoccus indicus]
MRIMTANGPVTGRRRGAFIATLLGCSSALAVMATGLHAQQTEDEVVVLDPIVVEGQDNGSIVALQSNGAGRLETPFLDSAASVSVVTEAEIRARGAETVEDVLSYTAGVVTDQYGADDRFHYFKVRGFDPNTYRDGLPLGTPFGAIREEAYAYDRFEIVKGANSSSFGISDPGGVVNYQTKLPKSDRFGEVYSTVGSNDRVEAGFDIGDNLTRDDTLSYRLTGKLRDGESDYEQSRNDEKFLMGGLTWRPDDATSVNLVVDVLDRDGVPGSGGFPVGGDFDRSDFFGEPDFNYRGTDRTTATLIMNRDLGGGLSVGSTLRYSDTDSDFGYAYVSGGSGTIANRAYFTDDSHDHQLIGEAHLQYDTTLNGIDSRSLLGVEYSKSTEGQIYGFGAAPDIDWTNPVYTGAPDSVPVITDTLTRTRGRAIYGQQELTFADRYVLSLGLRHDWLDTRIEDRLAGTTSRDDISETTGRVGLTYKATDELSVYGSFAQSVVPAGTGLAPERGEQYELGVKYAPLSSRSIFSAAVYDLTKDNITRTDPVTNMAATIGKVRVRGLDLEAKTELTPNLTMTAAYSYVDSEIVENGTAGNEGNRLALIPEHSGSVWVNYRLDATPNLGQMTFGLGARYVGSYEYDDANTASTSGHVLLDAAYTYQVDDRTELSVNVSNLTDEKYSAYGGLYADFYNAGREVSATLRRNW